MHHACIVHVVSMCPVRRFLYENRNNFCTGRWLRAVCASAPASDATSTCIAGCSLHAFWLGDFAKRSAQNTTHERARTAASATPDRPHYHTRTLPRSCNVALWTTGTGAAGIPRIRAPAPQPDLKADPQPTSFAWSAL
jgi:hypothetical protein